MLCPCNRCEQTVLRTGQATKKHVEDWGRWNENVLDEQMRAHASNKLVDFLLLNPSLHKWSNLNKPTHSKKEQRQSEGQADELMEEHVQEPLNGSR